MRPESVLASLLVDQALAGAVDPAAASLLWTADGREVLWASPAATAIAAQVPAAARQRIALLAGGLAPETGIRLERLRIGSALGGEPVTFACQRVALAAGGEGLLTTAVGALPPRLRPAREGAGISHEPPFSPLSARGPQAAAAGPAAADPLAGVREIALARASLRFVWQSDADGVFTAVSPDLARVVGAPSAVLVGRRWEDLGGIVLDGREAVAEAFASRRTWSGLPVLWRIAGSDRAVPVDLGAVPVLGEGRALAGFRGFGICRVRDLKEAPPGRAAQTPLPQAAGGAPESALPADSQPSDSPPADSPSTGGQPGRATTTGLSRRVAEPPASRVVPFPQAPNGPGRNGAGRLRTPPPSGEALPPDDAGEPDGRAGRREAEAVKPPAKPTLSVVERHAFREIARALGARFAGDEDLSAGQDDRGEPEGFDEPDRRGLHEDAGPGASESAAPLRPVDAAATALLDRLPIGIVVARGERPLYANPAFLDLAGYRSLDDLAAMGLTRVFGGSVPKAHASLPSGEETRATIRTASGRSIAVAVDVSQVDWSGVPATLVAAHRSAEPEAEARLRALETELRSHALHESELAAILDTATDGVVVFDEEGRILTLNRSAEALFGYEEREVAGESFACLLAPESHALAFDYFDSLKADGVGSVLNDGREVVGRVRQGGHCPLFMTIGRIGGAPAGEAAGGSREDGRMRRRTRTGARAADTQVPDTRNGAGRTFCAVLRDLTAWKKAERELLDAKRAAERASTQKSDFLARISHEVRTPLNAMIGFAEVMLEERFGPIGNERYKEYIRDIHASGGHVISLVNDLLDLAKIEAGRLDLVFTGVHLNDIVSHCVALMQPQANRDRIVLRTALTPKLPPIVADERAMRQIMLNVLSNALKFTDAGGQVIISTTLTDRGEVMLRVRDTGIGMTDGEIEAALEPFRQLATTRRTSGTGLGLPLTKALTEANRGALVIKSVKHEGTLVEILMPSARVLAG